MIRAVIHYLSAFRGVQNIDMLELPPRAAVNRDFGNIASIPFPAALPTEHKDLAALIFALAIHFHGLGVFYQTPPVSSD